LFSDLYNSWKGTILRWLIAFEKVDWLIDFPPRFNFRNKPLML
jgi:hypothetical protein